MEKPVRGHETAEIPKWLLMTLRLGGLA